MALRLYHNLDGSTGVDVELVAPGSGVRNIGSIVISNTSTSAIASISLKLYNDTTKETFQLQAKASIPVGVTMIIDDESLLGFDNSRRGFGLYAFIGASTECDVLINLKSVTTSNI